MERKRKDLGKDSNHFNSVGENYRSMESLKKCYQHTKKQVRRQVTIEKVEIIKTGGGQNTIKYDPVHEQALALLNTKTVEGIANQFDNDHMIDSLQGYGTDSVLDENEIENTPITEESEAYMMKFLEVLEDSYENIRDVANKCTTNGRRYSSIAPLSPDKSRRIYKKQILQSTENDVSLDVSAPAAEQKNSPINWGDWKTSHLRNPLNKKFHAAVSEYSKNSTEESLQTEKWSSRHRPATVTQQNSLLSKQYADLAAIKLELAAAQLEIIKSEFDTKKKRDEIEFHLKPKAMQLDIKIKKAQFKKVASGLYADFNN